MSALTPEGLRQKICLAYQGDVQPCATACLHCERIARKLSSEELPETTASIKRPLAWRVQFPPPRGWAIFTDENAAYLEAERTHSPMQGLYVLDGSPIILPSSDGWQDIKTAPTDQRSILAINVNSQIQKVCWRSATVDGYFEWGAGPTQVWTPTHWRPLGFGPGQSLKTAERTP